MPCWMARLRPCSSVAVRQVTTPSPTGRWAFACSTRLLSARSTLWRRGGLSRVAVIDIDVHHGNGTQATAEREPRLFFGSVHQGWIYPGTGAAHETGRHGNIANRPLPAGANGATWHPALDELIEAVRAFGPQLLLVSAGFDAHKDDPLAGLSLEEADFARAGTALARLAQETTNSRLVCVLEGGYDCPALERSVAAFVGALQAA